MKTNILRLGDLLTERKISGKDFADQIGLTPASVSNIIQGKSFPKPETLQKIAEVLDVDIRELLVSTKETATEPIYLKRDGDFIEVGSLNLKG